MKTFRFGSVFYRPVSLLLVVATIIDSSLSLDQLSARAYPGSIVEAPAHARHCHRSHDFTMATPCEHAHYMTKWLIGHTHSQKRWTHPQLLNRCPDNTKRACHRRARSKMEWIYIRTTVSGHGSLELAQENRKKERKKE